MDLGNMGRLRPYDEVKFVVGDRQDFDWACDLVERYALPDRCHAVLFSPVFGALNAATLAEWVLDARLNARVQLPLHTALGIR